MRARGVGPASELKDIKSAEEAAICARRMLPAKNALNSADARQIEDAFQARLAIREGPSEGPDGLARLMSGSNTTVEQAEGSIRKLRPAIIDKSNLPYPEPRRIR